MQNYNIRPFAGAQMESHKKYCDLQYIVSGNEKIYWPSLRKLTVVDDHTEDGDYLLYESGVDQGYTLMKRGIWILCTGGWTYAKHCCDRSGAGYEDRV